MRLCGEWVKRRERRDVCVALCDGERRPTPGALYRRCRGRRMLTTESLMRRGWMLEAAVRFGVSRQERLRALAQRARRRRVELMRVVCLQRQTEQTLRSLTLWERRSAE